MTDEDLDDLPIHLRNKILEHWGTLQATPRPRRVTTGRVLLLAFGYIWAAPWVILGLLLCATIVFLVVIPIGPLCLYIGTWPITHAVKRMTQQS